MIRRLVTAGAAGAAMMLGLVGLGSVASAAPAPLLLTLSQGQAFAILGASCGGIQEQGYVTGFDPTTGTSTTIGRSPFVNTGSQSFPTPSAAHSDGTHDWVLVLQ